MDGNGGRSGRWPWSWSWSPSRVWLRATTATTLIFATLVSLSTQQKDPIRDFCRRFGHQTAVVDRKLYIDGGLINWNPLSQDGTNYTNSWLMYQDLDVDHDGMPQIYANLSKNASIPSVHGGVLWADEVNHRLYLFGGEYQTARPPTTFNLFAYDIWYDEWHNFGPPNAGGIKGVSYGAGVSVSERGEGYYYGGYVSEDSSGSWTGNSTTTGGMIRYEYDDNAWTNSTGPEDNIPRAEGVLLHIPSGDGGMLVYFGGVKDPLQNGTLVAQPMEEILVYDVVSSKWYAQNATGTIPEYRRKLCAGVAWAEDRSSYNIYLYGGLGFGDQYLGFDDVYILSLPSFTWIKYYPLDSPGTGDFPHHSLSCNVVNSGSQMLIIGGSFPGTDVCDSEQVWGTHNLDLTKQINPPAMWAAFEPDVQGHKVPEDIHDVIGGGPEGGAMKTEPEGGFVARDLGVLMTRTASAAERTVTPGRVDPRASEPTGDSDDDNIVGGGDEDDALSTGAIAGIAVGGFAAFCAVMGGLWVWRKKRGGEGKGGKPQPPAELPVQQRDILAPMSPYGQSYAGSGSPTLLVSPQQDYQRQGAAGGGYQQPRHGSVGTGGTDGGNPHFSWTSTPTGSPPVPIGSTSPRPGAYVAELENTAPAGGEYGDREAGDLSGQVNREMK